MEVLEEKYNPIKPIKPINSRKKLVFHKENKKKEMENVKNEYEILQNRRQLHRYLDKEFYKSLIN